MSPFSSCSHSEVPWIAVNSLAFTRTPLCELFFEDFYDISTERALTFILTNTGQTLVHQILPIVKKF